MSPDRNVTAKILKPLKESADGFGAVLAVEEVGTEVDVLDAVAQHVVRRGEHGRCDGEDGLLGTRR